MGMKSNIFTHCAKFLVRALDSSLCLLSFLYSKAKRPRPKKVKEEGPISQIKLNLNFINFFAFMNFLILQSKANHQKYFDKKKLKIYSPFLRWSTARGLVQGSPTKVEAFKSFVINESSLLLKIKNTWLLCYNAQYSSKV